MIERFSDQASLAQAASLAIEHALSHAVAARGHALFIATGGRTPGAVYDCLAAAPVDWSKVVVSLTDERWVGSGDPESNEGLIRDRLLRGRASHARFVPLKGEAPTPEAAAREASARLAELGAPDALLLGMGEDGHVASLFPRNTALAKGLAAQAPPCIAAPKGERGPPPQARLSLSARWLAAAGCAVLLITGARKLEVIEQALAGSNAEEFPVRAILQQATALRILWAA
jgi:6-phosphogluconolactonase